MVRFSGKLDLKMELEIDLVRADRRNPWKRESHYSKEENKMAQAGKWGFGKHWTLKVKNP